MFGQPFFIGALNRQSVWVDIALPYDMRLVWNKSTKLVANTAGTITQDVYIPVRYGKSRGTLPLVCPYPQAHSDFWPSDIP
jgi:hypothetical protein